MWSWSVLGWVLFVNKSENCGTLFLIHVLNNFYSALPPGLNGEQVNQIVEVVCCVMALPMIYLLYRMARRFPKPAAAPAMAASGDADSEMRPKHPAS